MCLPHAPCLAPLPLQESGIPKEPVLSLSAGPRYEVATAQLIGHDIYPFVRQLDVRQEETFYINNSFTGTCATNDVL